MTSSVPFAWLVLVGVGTPALVFGVLGGASLFNRQLPERWTGALAAAAMTTSSLAFVAALVAHGVTQTGPQLLSYGEWSTTHEGGIAIEFLVDRLSLGFAALSAAITGIVSAFSNRYLHREPGYTGTSRSWRCLSRACCSWRWPAMSKCCSSAGSWWASVRRYSSGSSMTEQLRSQTHFACYRSIGSATLRCSLRLSCCAIRPAATACRSCSAVEPPDP